MEEKDMLAILVENVLYNRVRAFDEDHRLTFKQKENNKQEAIEMFVCECIERFKTIPEEEIREYVQTILNRTINNMKDIGR